MDQDNLEAFQVFGTRKPYSATEENWHREQQRRSFDIIRIKNPDEKDFHFDWDKRWYVVPAHGTSDVMRYLAITYCRNKSIDVINKLTDKMHAQDLEDRSKKGLPAFQDKNAENKETYESARYPKTNDKALLTKLYSEYWVGIVSEYGKDTPPPENQPEPGFDMTSLELKIIHEMNSRRVNITEQAPVKEEHIFKQKLADIPKSKLEKEITVDE